MILKIQGKLFELEMIQSSNFNERFLRQAQMLLMKIILIKDDGILPGANSFPLNNNSRRRHPFGRPRMRGRGINIEPAQNIEGLGNIPEVLKVRFFTEVDISRNARRDNREDQCPAPEFDMKKRVYNLNGRYVSKRYRIGM